MTDDVQLALNQDLVAAMVKLDGATRRLDMVEKEKERLNASLSDAQVWSKQRVYRVSQQTNTLLKAEGKC